MDSDTKADLIARFTRCASTNRRCLAFGQKALDEKLPEAARLFRAIARSAAIQAARLLTAAAGIGTTADNLNSLLDEARAALIDELPDEINRAQAAGSTPARVALEHAHAAFLSIAELLEQALDRYDAAPASGGLFVCSICGFLVQGDAPDVCPSCGVNKKLLPAVE
jgi:rubrerythrin